MPGSVLKGVTRGSRRYMTYVFSRCRSISGVHLTSRCLFTRLAFGKSTASFGERKILSAFETSFSVKGSVATLSGLVQLPLIGAEKAELPQEETEESENEEQTQPNYCAKRCS